MELGPLRSKRPQSEKERAARIVEQPFFLRQRIEGSCYFFGLNDNSTLPGIWPNMP